VAGLRCDDYGRAATGDDAAELLQHERRAIEIDLEDRRGRGLRGGHARGMDKSAHLPKASGGCDERFNRLSRGHVHRRGAYVVTGVPHHLGRALRILPAHVGQQDVLSDSDPARDCLANLTGSDDDDDFSHDKSLRFRFGRPGRTTAPGSSRAV